MTKLSGAGSATESEADRVSNKAELDTISDSDSSSSGMEDGFRTDVLAPAVLLFNWQARCLLSQLPAEPPV